MVVLMVSISLRNGRLVVVGAPDGVNNGALLGHSVWFGVQKRTRRTPPEGWFWFWFWVHVKKGSHPIGYGWSLAQLKDRARAAP